MPRIGIIQFQVKNEEQKKKQTKNEENEIANSTFLTQPNRKIQEREKNKRKPNPPYVSEMVELQEQQMKNKI